MLCLVIYGISWFSSNVRIKKVTIILLTHSKKVGDLLNVRENATSGVLAACIYDLHEKKESRKMMFLFVSPVTSECGENESGNKRRGERPADRSPETNLLLSALTRWQYPQVAYNKPLL